MLLEEIEAAELEGNDDRLEGVLCGAVKQLKVTRAKPDSTLYLSLMYLAKIKPNIFATEGVIEVRAGRAPSEPAPGGLCPVCLTPSPAGSVQPPAAGRLHQLQGQGQQPGVRAGLQPPHGRVRGGRELARDLRQGGSASGSRGASAAVWGTEGEGRGRRGPEVQASVLSSQVYIEDSLGERVWVDSLHCKTFVDNIQTAFNTKTPPKSMLLQGEAGRGGGDLSAGEGRRAGGAGLPSGRAGGLLPPRRPGSGRPHGPPPAGNSPHPSLTEEEDSQAELLIAEEKLSPEQEGQLMPR